jgi:F-box and WD-40 domain protein 1/11
VISAHRGPVNAIQLKDNVIVSASGDTFIKMWDIETGECLREFEGHTRGLACVQYDGKRIVSGSNDKRIKVWDVKTGQCIMTCEGA